MQAGKQLREGIAAIPELKVLGDPLWVISFAARDPGSLDVYRVSDEMSKRRWNLNGLHRPSCVHIAVTLRHTQAGVVERFLADLRAAVEHVKRTPAEPGGMAPVYGVAAKLPARGAVRDVLGMYMDALYEV
jgi:sphinganine-1-phosphate aldolase